MSKGNICNTDTHRLKQVLQFKLNTQDRARSSHSLLSRLQEQLGFQITDTEAPGVQNKAVTFFGKCQARGPTPWVVKLIFMLIKICYV